MLYRDIRNNRRKINESDRRVRTFEDQTGKFDKIIAEKDAYWFKVKIDFVTIEIFYEPVSGDTSVVTGISSTGNTSMNNLICDPDLLCEIADFMKPLLDQNNEIDTKVLEEILSDNNL